MTTPCVAQISYGESLTAPLGTGANDVLLPFVATAKITQKAKYSENPNHIRDWENVFEVETVIYDENGTANIELLASTIRRTLNRPGLNLRINYQGVGHQDLFVNELVCLRGGPYPQEVVVQPFAGNSSIYIKWTVAFYTPQGRCDSLSLNENHVVDNSFEMDWKVNDEGMVRMSLSGYITYSKIITNLQFKNSMDRMFSRFLSPYTDYYHSVGYETSFSKKLMGDKRTIQYSLELNERDTGNAYFPYTKTIDMDHEIESSLFGDSMFGASGFRIWNGTISGTIHLPPRIHKAWTYVIFRRIVMQRLDRLRLMLKDTLPADDSETPVYNQNFRGKFLPLRIKIREPLYGRSSYFEFEYIFTSDLDHMLTHSNLFTRVNTVFDYTRVLDGPDTYELDQYSNVENTTHRTPATIAEQWAAHRNTLGLSGTTGLYDYNLSNIGIIRFSPCTDSPYESDLIPSLSFSDADGEGGRRNEYLTEDDYSIGTHERRYVDHEDPLDTLKATSAEVNETVYDDPLSGNQVTTPSTGSNGEALLGRIEPQDSWVAYQQEFEIEEEAGTIPVRYMEAGNADYYNTPESLAATNANANRTWFTINGQSPAIAYMNAPSTVIRRPSAFTVVMRGYAVRVGHSIPTPVIVSVNNGTAELPAIRIGKPRWQHSTIASGSKYPVYLATWEIRYTINGSLGPGDLAKAIKTNGTPGDYV